MGPKFSIANVASESTKHREPTISTAAAAPHSGVPAMRQRMPSELAFTIIVTKMHI